MGGHTFDSHDWATHSASASVRNATVHSAFARTLDDSINPAKIKDGVREARDSDVNPNSTPIIFGLDFTGSMQDIPLRMLTTDLGVMFREIFERKPVSDPQICFAGVGDVVMRDPAPFQVGQFEAGCTQLVESLKSFWLDGCAGGGNGYESYDLPYWFAAHHTITDAFQKRGKKGFLFTIGDEHPPEIVRAQDIQTVFGYTPQSDVSFADLIGKVRQQWIPYHIVIEHRGALPREMANWKKLLGANAILLTDYTKIGEVIVSILQAEAGVSKADIVRSWDGNTALVVASALRDVVTQQPAGKLVQF